MRAAVYLRVSTEKQDVENQRQECKLLCAARRWEPIWKEEVESSVKARPVWDQVVELARRGEVGAVVFWSLDRIGRSREQISADLARLSQYRVEVASVKDAWLEQRGPMRDLLIQVLGWVAQGERRRIVERTRAALDDRKGKIRAAGGFVAKRSGIWRSRLGRPALGESLVKTVRALWEGGKSAYLIARETGVPESTVRTYTRRWEASAKKA